MRRLAEAIRRAHARADAAIGEQGQNLGIVGTLLVLAVIGVSGAVIVQSDAVRSWAVPDSVEVIEAQKAWIDYGDLQEERVWRREYERAIAEGVDEIKAAERASAKSSAWRKEYDSNRPNFEEDLKSSFPWLTAGAVAVGGVVAFIVTRKLLSA